LYVSHVLDVNLRDSNQNYRNKHVAHCLSVLRQPLILGLC
jgi:hypothetical protein